MFALAGATSHDVESRAALANTRLVMVRQAYDRTFCNDGSMCSKPACDIYTRLWPTARCAVPARSSPRVPGEH